MKKIVFPAVLLAALTLTSFPGVVASEETASGQQLYARNERKLPPMTNLISANQGTVPPTPWYTQAIIIDVWASWCGPCRHQIPVLHELKRKYGAKLTVIGISTDDSSSDHQAAIKALKITYPSCLAANKTNAQFLDALQKATGQQITGIPHLVIADGSGNIVYAQSGMRDKDELERILAPLMKAK
ncbi:MAG: TlpA disulfide reductase family protein [bacterium]|nr:TlpA disulfide reductase family protein [bacterium]